MMEAKSKENDLRKETVHGIRVAFYGHEETQQAAELQKKVDCNFAEKLGINLLEYYLDFGSDYSAYRRMFDDCQQEMYSVVIIHSVKCLNDLSSETKSKICDIKKLPRSVNWWFVLEDLTTLKSDDCIFKSALMFAWYEYTAEMGRKEANYMHDLQEIQKSIETNDSNNGANNNNDKLIHTVIYIRAEDAKTAELEKRYYFCVAVTKHQIVDEVYIDIGKSKDAIEKLKSDAVKGRFHIITLHGFSCFNYSSDEIESFVSYMHGLPEPIYCFFDLEAIYTEDDNYREKLEWASVFYGLRQTTGKNLHSYQKCEKAYIEQKRLSLINAAGLFLI